MNRTKHSIDATSIPLEDSKPEALDRVSEDEIDEVVEEQLQDGDDEPAAKRLKTGTRSRKKRTSGKPKRPLSAFNFFYKEESARWMEENKEKKRSRPHKQRFLDMGKDISRRWRELDPKKREKYHKAAQDDFDRYDQEMAQHCVEEASKPREPEASDQFKENGAGDDTAGTNAGIICVPREAGDSSSLGLNAARSTSTASVVESSAARPPAIREPTPPINGLGFDVSKAVAMVAQLQKANQRPSPRAPANASGVTTTGAPKKAPPTNLLQHALQQLQADLMKKQENERQERERREKERQEREEQERLLREYRDWKRREDEKKRATLQADQLQQITGLISQILHGSNVEVFDIIAQAAKAAQLTSTEVPRESISDQVLRLLQTSVGSPRQSSPVHNPNHRTYLGATVESKIPAMNAILMQPQRAVPPPVAAPLPARQPIPTSGDSNDDTNLQLVQQLLLQIQDQLKQPRR